LPSSSTAVSGSAACASSSTARIGEPTARRPAGATRPMGAVVWRQSTAVTSRRGDAASEAHRPDRRLLIVSARDIRPGRRRASADRRSSRHRGRKRVLPHAHEILRSPGLTPPRHPAPVTPSKRAV
jgi:hypothetical protein